MPELPEVEHTRRKLERASVGRRVARVVCADDPIVVVDGAPAVERALDQATIVAAHRHGKWLWLELDRRPHLLLHLGMTGSVRVPGDEPLRLESTPEEVDRGWPPRFSKLTLELDDAAPIAFTNARRLGRLLVRDDPRTTAPLSKLGFDPLNGLPSLADFHGRLTRRRGLIKGLLLDQTFAAGVGNWMADEILFRAAIDPRRKVDSLSEDDVRRLHAAVEHIVRTAVDADAIAERYPPSWLFHHRWDKRAQTSDGAPIAYIKAAGRTTAWVPSRQR